MSVVSARSRLGVALLIPDPHAGEVDGLRRALGHRSLGRIPAHITLIPPVNVAGDQVAEAASLMASAAGHVPPMRLALGPVRTFAPETPVLYLAVGGDVADLRRLRDDVAEGPLGRPPLRPFVPHVTITEDVAPDLIDPAVRLLAGYRSEVTVDAVQLLRQDDDRIWRVIASAGLQGERIIGRGGLELRLSVGDVLDPEGQAFLDREPSPRSFAITARREGAVVGVATGWTDDELTLDRLVVDAGARAQGVGSHLLAEVENLGATRGCEVGLLVCRRPQSWYESRGWTTDLHLTSWRHGLDFVRMTRRLG